MNYIPEGAFMLMHLAGDVRESLSPSPTEELDEDIEDQEAAVLLCTTKRCFASCPDPVVLPYPNIDEKKFWLKLELYGIIPKKKAGTTVEKEQPALSWITWKCDGAKLIEMHVVVSIYQSPARRGSG